MFLGAIATFVTTVSFSVLLLAPKREWIFCGVSGVLSFFMHRILTVAGVHFVLATLGATMVLALVSRSLARVRCQPVTVYLLPGIFPLAPGAGIYFSAIYLMAGNMEAFFEKGMEALETAVAIALGIVFASGWPKENLRPRK